MSSIICYSSILLHLQLKEKNKTLKAEIYTVRQLNYQLQQGLINRVFGKLPEDLDVINLPEIILRKVPEPQLTDDGVSRMTLLMRYDYDYILNTN